MQLFNEEEAAIKILSVLKEKYPERDWSVEDDKSKSFFLEDTIVWTEDFVFINQVVNYLLALNDDQIRSFLWNKCYARENGYYDGLYKELLNELDKAKEQWSLEFDEYRSDTRLHNQTQPIKSGELILRPTTLSDSEELQRIVECDNTPTNEGFAFSMKQFNQKWRATFTVWNCSNEIVGYLALSDISGYIASVPTMNTFNLEYYICPEFRGRHYSEISSKALLDAAFDGKIMINKDGDEYGKRYSFVTIPIEMKIVKSIVRIENVSSYKTAKAIGFKDYGSIITADKDNTISEFKNLVLVNEKI